MFLPPANYCVWATAKQVRFYWKVCLVREEKCILQSVRASSSEINAKNQLNNNGCWRCIRWRKGWGIIWSNYFCPETTSFTSCSLLGKTICHTMRNGLRHYVWDFLFLWGPIRPPTHNSMKRWKLFQSILWHTFIFGSLTLWFQFKALVCLSGVGGYVAAILNLDSVFRCWASMMITAYKRENTMRRAGDAFCCCWFLEIFMGISSRRWVKIDATHHTFTRTYRERAATAHPPIILIIFVSLQSSNVIKDFSFCIFNTMIKFHTGLAS